MSPGSELSLKAKFAIAAVSAALFVWFLPAVNAYIRLHIEPENVQTFALSVRCRLPEQHEQVTVLVRDAGGAGQRGDCVYVRGRGAYGVSK